MTSLRIHAIASVVVALVAGVSASCSVSSSVSSTTSTTAAKQVGTPVSMQAPAPYTPSAPNGGTDDYHCTLVDPHVTQDSMIVASNFYPGSYEVHHAIFYLIPPNVVPEAVAKDDGGKGWTCFGDTDLAHTSYNLPFSGMKADSTPWLAAWAPGLNSSVAPPGTGVLLPKGTMVVMQIHYNMLLGDAPVQPKLTLSTVPAAGTTLQPLQLDLIVAPPDAPCPAGATGDRCTRSGELANLGQRFGPGSVGFDQGIESACGRDPQNPPISNTTTCTWTVYQPEYLLRTTAHMHLMGQAMKIVVNPGTKSATTVLDVPNFDFHFQRGYDLSSPVHLQAGDKVQITCTFDPSRELTDSSLNKVPPHFVTWGDGSSDEMCLGILQSVSKLSPAVKP